MNRRRWRTASFFTSNNNNNNSTEKENCHEIDSNNHNHNNIWKKKQVIRRNGYSMTVRGVVFDGGNVSSAASDIQYGVMRRRSRDGSTWSPPPRLRRIDRSPSTAGPGAVFRRRCSSTFRFWFGFVRRASAVSSSAVRKKRKQNKTKEQRDRYRGPVPTSRNLIPFFFFDRKQKANSTIVPAQVSQIRSRSFWSLCRECFVFFFHCYSSMNLSTANASHGGGRVGQSMSQQKKKRKKKKKMPGKIIDEPPSQSVRIGFIVFFFWRKWIFNKNDSQ